MKTNTSEEDMIYDITRQDRGGLGMTGQKKYLQNRKEDIMTRHVRKVT